jgi:hypothetical protein
VQASSLACSALQAEAHALELAAQIGKLLQVQEPNFFTDSQILADALTKRDPKNHPGHWTIRPNLLQFLKHTEGNQARVFKIKREKNICCPQECAQGYHFQYYRSLCFQL